MSEDSWKFAQCFGDKGESDDVTESDIISAVEFDHSGDFLATGDKGGRIVLFERSDGKKHCEYKFYTEFQSHEPEFDYLKSLEIEEKINKIRWLKRQNSAHLLLSTNDKTIKLWKVFEKSIKVVSELNTADGSNPQAFRQAEQLSLPKMIHHDSMTAAIPRKIYQNAHTYHIHSLSPNSDGETFLSADDLRINLWNLNVSDQSFNIVDVKPPNLEELSEVITATAFHPKDCNSFVFSTSRGTIRMNDMRMSALCDQSARVLEDTNDGGNRNFFSEITTSISDLSFSADGRYILSRDYLDLKVWDMHMDSGPIMTMSVHDHLRSRLCDLYENDFIFDRFDCTFSGDGSHVLTGSYSNFFHIYNIKQPNPQSILLQADKSVFKAKKVGSTKNKLLGTSKKNKREEYLNVEGLDFNKKILHAGWHPRENIVALAATNNLFLFAEQ